ncbi:MAG: hypothetical protein JWM82_143 [Myxococcales bacterium]|nr:hypothetical protein [Myxococcales bacterium]
MLLLQTTPQPPQFLGSASSCTHAPPHDVNPAAHDEAHTPRSHTFPAEHATPQAPQLPRLDFTSTHTPPHDVSPVPQTHSPELHARPAGQATSHAPQWSRSLPVATQAPAHFVVPVEQTTPFGSGTAPDASAWKMPATEASLDGESAGNDIGRLGRLEETLVPASVSAP